MIAANINISPELIKLIDISLQKELEKEFDEAIIKFNHRRVEILARVLLSVHKEVSMQKIGENIVFTIKEITKEDKK